MFSHICLGTNNFTESIKFYEQAISSEDLKPRNECILLMQ